MSIVPGNVGLTLYLNSLLSQNSWKAGAAHTPTNKHRAGLLSSVCVSGTANLHLMPLVSHGVTD